MKKIKLFSAISTLLICSSFFFVSCQKKEATPAKNEVKQETKVEAPKEVTGLPFTVYCNALWASPFFEVQNDWESIEIIFDSVPDQNLFQFNIVSDSVESEQSWGTAYHTLYPSVEEKNVFNIEECLSQITNDAGQSLKDLGATKIVQIRIQSKVADEVSLSALSAIVTKKDGSKEALIPSGDWGSTVEDN